jgi:DNA invertase Pin-like site-specific DNA recombinase
MKCFLYARTGSVPQLYKGSGTTKQQSVLRKFARDKGWHVAAVFTDKGESALNMKRPQLQEMLRLCRQKRNIDVVLAESADRIARRSSDLIDIWRELQRAGTHLVVMNASLL